MASDPPSQPRFFLDEERNQSFAEKLANNARPSSERHSVAAIRAIVDDDEDEDDARATSSSSTLATGHLDLDIEAQQSSAAKPDSLWTKLLAGWEDVEDKLAEWFGLDQSKYQWAVDELLERQLVGDQPPSKAIVVGLQMQNIQEQSMQRNLNF